LTFFNLSVSISRSADTVYTGPIDFLEGCMAPRYNFFIVDDDRIFIKLISKVLEPLALNISHTVSSNEALDKIVDSKPDCVILDMMMPELDGLEVLEKLRAQRELEGLKVIIISGKTYEFDRKRALDFGADGYITKPVDRAHFINKVKTIMADKVLLGFWGVRGTLPVPGEQSVIYGGNTSCISLEFPRGNFFVFDAGTGIKVLSDRLMARENPPTAFKIFISHPHWDHINALPFFMPLYIQGNDVEICGPSHGDITMQEMISGQMDGIHFPINTKEFSARVLYRELKEEAFDIDGITVRTIFLNHPGHCLGYRVRYRDRSISYITDNELFPKGNPYFNEYYVERLTEFIRDSDFLITDSTYTPEEYRNKIGWGHSSVEQVVEIADRAKVKDLFLFHHDPAQSDKDIAGKFATANEILKKLDSSTRCIVPKEKQIFSI
jgi:phosphoribosyl 1,2-cyclic phosphodiesterase/CheY-like chemotaxis protein